LVVRQLIRVMGVALMVVVRAHRTAQAAAAAAAVAAAAAAAATAAAVTTAAETEAAFEEASPAQVNLDAACLRDIRAWIAHTEAVTAAGTDRTDSNRGTFAYIRLIGCMEAAIGPITTWSLRSNEEIRAAFVNVPG
jgi:hypothetical protein